MIHPQKYGHRPPEPHPGEQGYLLLGLLFLFVILLIGLAIAAPKIGKEIQREKEAETVHRGEQYKRAIQLYYRKFGAYPTSISQLKETNQIRFLRQDYIDPMTGKKDWKLLHLGQVQMVTLGFFGQVVQAGGATPGAGMPGANGAAATGMSGAGGVAGGIGGSSSMGAAGGSFGSSGPGSNSSMGGGLSNTSNGNDSLFNDSSSSGSNSSGGSQDGNPSANGSETGQITPPSDPDRPNDQADEASPGDSVGGDNPSGVGGTGLSPGSPMTSSSGGMDSGGMNSGSTFGFNNSQSNGSLGGANGAPSVQGLPGSTAAGGGLSGAAASGGPIVGVTVPLKQASIIVYRKKKVYDKWQFVYNPQEEITAAVAQGNGQVPGAGIGSPAGGTTSGGVGGSSTFGSSGSGFGSSSGGSGPSSGGFGSSSGGLGSTSSNASGSPDSSNSNSNPNSNSGQNSNSTQNPSNPF